MSLQIKSLLKLSYFRKTLIVNKQSQILENKNIAYQIDSVRQQIEVPSQEPLFLENQAFIDRCLKKSNLKVPDLKSSIEVMKVANKVINFKL